MQLGKEVNTSGIASSALVGLCAFQTLTTKENTGIRKLQVNPSATKYKPPSPVQMQNCYLHLQSLVRGERRVYNQLPFNNSSELRIFFKDGFHVQDSPCKPDLQRQEVKGRGVSNSLGQTKYSLMFYKLPAFLPQISITEYLGLLKLTHFHTNLYPYHRYKLRYKIDH